MSRDEREAELVLDLLAEQAANAATMIAAPATLTMNRGNPTHDVDLP